MRYGYDYATITNPSAELTDFCLLIDLSRMSSGFKLFWNTSLNGYGRATKEDGTELPCDWINLNHTAKTGFLRVKYTGILSDSGTQRIRIYPPNLSNVQYSVSDTYGKYAVYTGHFAYVPMDGDLNDRSINSVDLINSGASVTTGKVGSAYDFDGSSHLEVGGQWHKIGGDGLNGSWAAGTYEFAYTPIVFNGDLYVGLGNTAGDAEVWKWDGTVWTKIGGDGINFSWAAGTYELAHILCEYNGNLYAGLSQSAGDAEVWKWDGVSWSLVGGDAVNSSWADLTYEYLLCLLSLNDKLYASLGASTGDAEIWVYNGTVWSKIGGDEINSSWESSPYEYVQILEDYNGYLYAGLSTVTDGGIAGAAEVWKYDHISTTWSKIGGDAVNSSWADATYETVNALKSFNGKLYAGLGWGTNDAEIWEFNGASWLLIGGDGKNGSWDVGTYETVYSIDVYNNVLYASLGWTASGDAEIWKWSGTDWTKIAGDGVNSSWYSGTYGRVANYMPTYNGEMIAALLGVAGDAEIWKYSDSSNSISNLLTSTKGTWSFWMAPLSATPATTNVVMCFGSSTTLEFINILFSATSLLRILCYDNGVAQWDLTTDEAVLSSGVWNHVDIVHDGTEPAIYINGVKVAQTFTVTTKKSAWFNDLSNVNNGRLGDRYINNSAEAFFYSGKIDDFQLFLDNKSQAWITEEFDQSNNQATFWGTWSWLSTEDILFNLEDKKELLNVSQYIDLGINCRFLNYEGNNIDASEIVVNTSGNVTIYGKAYQPYEAKTIYLTSGKIHKIGGIHGILSSGTDKNIGIHVKV